MIVIISSFRIDKLIIFIEVDRKLCCEETIRIDKAGGATHEEPRDLFSGRDHKSFAHDRMIV